MTPLLLAVGAAEVHSTTVNHFGDAVHLEDLGGSSTATSVILTAVMIDDRIVAMMTGGLLGTTEKSTFPDEMGLLQAGRLIHATLWIRDQQLRHSQLLPHTLRQTASLPPIQRQITQTPGDRPSR